MRIGAQTSHTGIMPSGHVLAQAPQFALRFANELRLYNVIGVFGVLDQRSQRHSVPQVAGNLLCQLLRDAGAQRLVEQLQLLSLAAHHHGVNTY